MNSRMLLLPVLLLLVNVQLFGQEKDFQHEQNQSEKPWTERGFENDPDNFQFAIMSDRTGGHRAGVFGKAVEKLNLLQPEFVMCVGDLIEGYTKDEVEIDRQWAEFDSLLNPLAMRFFFLPGNHDISNEVMRKEWMERYGRAYYHFLYKDVLFLVMDSNDGDDDATLSREQIDYMKKALADHPEVRWTLVFMHHPIWLYSEFNGFAEVEDVLKDRDYTVYAGHFHRYMQAIRKDRNYYVLASTGGGSRLRGPKFGEFDHISWVTMTNEGPIMLNLKLDGMLDHDVATGSTSDLARALIGATNFHSLMTMNTGRTAGELSFGITNSGKDTLHFEGRVYHHHQLELEQSELALTIAPQTTEQLRIGWNITGDQPWERIDPIELDFSIGYRTEQLEPDFKLSGTYTVPKVLKEGQIQFTDVDVFTDQHQVSLGHPFQEVSLRYTLDGSTPDATSPVYTGPITLSETTTVKAAVFTAGTKMVSGVLEQHYRKIEPLQAVKVKRSRPGLRYRYYEGNFEKLPDFSVLQPQKSGTANDLDVEALSGERLDHYAVQYEGFIEVPETGLYTFHLRSDDGAKLYLHDELVVDNDGSHSARTESGYIALEKGKHPLRIDYFEDFLGQTLRLYMTKPNESERAEVSFDILSR